jgi:gliding motility-associated-like protein
MILPKPELDSVPPIHICEGDVVVLQSIPLTDAGNSMATYTYHSNLPPDTSNLLDPLYYVPQETDTIYVHATAEICHDTLPIIIVVEAYPDFTLEGQPCDLIQGTYSVLFTSTADSIHSSKGIVVNNPTGQDAVTGIPNDSTVIIELLNSSGLCKDTFEIVAPNCNCPFMSPPLAAQASYSICADQAIPSLSVSVGAGFQANWYDVPSGGTALLSNSLTFIPPLASNIFYVEAFDPSNGCYSIRTEIPFNVNQIPQLQMLPDQVMCEPGSINFSTLVPAVLNGVTGAGQWFDLSNNQAVSGSIQPQNGDSWYYLFTSNPGGCSSSDTIAAVVNPLPTIDIFNVLCDDMALTFDILFTSDADIIVQSHGLLTHISGTDTFLLEGVPFDTDIQLDLENTVTGCVNTIIQPAPDCTCPPLLDDTAHEVCSDQGDVDLSAFEGQGVMGSWEIVSTPGGSNPATLAGDIFQGQNADPGTYSLRFIRSIILDDCIDTATFTLELSTSPFANAGADFTSCAPDNISLTGTGGGNNVQYGWVTTGSGVLSSTTSLNTTYTPTLADITAGSVTFTLTATDQTGFCPPASDAVTVTIDGSAYYILDPTTITQCDTSDLLVDLDDLVSFGTTGGTWFFPDTVSAPIISSSQFNPSMLTAGTYTVFYTTSNAVAPCENDTTGVTVIIENCSCPSVALTVPTNAICSESATQDLNDFLITTETGTWSIVNAPAGSTPATITGSIFTTNQSDGGIYQLRFTLSNPVAGCPAFAEIDFEVVPTPAIDLVSAICAADLLSWTAIIETDAENVTSDAGTLTNLGNGSYEISGIATGAGLQITATNSAGLCIATLVIEAPDCDCTLDITNLPDEVFLCIGESTDLEGQATGGKGAVTSFWIVANDSLYQNSLTVNQAGTYIFSSFDALGCRAEHEVEVTMYEEMSPDITTVDVACPGDNDGAIIINGIQGGNGPFFVSVNGQSAQQINSFPHVIGNLTGGNYAIEIQDGFNCIITLSLPVLSASSETLSLGPDQTILVGDSVLISPNLSFAPDTFYWTGDVGFLDVNVLSDWIRPDVDQTFTLFGIDENGCIYSDEITIRVNLSSSVYVPNVFSPNDDGINDLLTPMADGSVTTIEYFEVYSRWGELVYSEVNFPPGTKGWDGKRNDQYFQPGVFVYRLKATNKRQKEINLYGDVTLVR